MDERVWAIILAAGDGTRLRSLVRLLHGDERPKQFATIIGERSLLQTTIERTTRIAPPWRTVVVVSTEYAALARKQLGVWSAVRVLVQPRNRGTAAGILLPLAWIRARDPHARVAIFPSDHHVADPVPFVSAVRTALAAEGITLLGISGDRADTGLGWIEPERSAKFAVTAVARFVEKPHRTVAQALLRRGALWNAFVIAASIPELWALAEASLPTLTAALDALGTLTDEAALQRLYETLAPSDFSRVVLERAPDLSVIRVDGSGWADWGTPERIIESLERTPHLEPLLRSIVAAQKFALAGAA